MSVFSVWAVYAHPRDYPDDYVARRWEVEAIPPTKTGNTFESRLPYYKETPTDDIIVSRNLNDIQRALIEKGFIKLGRLIGDDPVIIQTWL